MSASNNAAAIAAANNPKRNHRSGDNSAVRSLSANLKYPYKRTISAPAGSCFCNMVSVNVDLVKLIVFKILFYIKYFNETSFKKNLGFTKIALKQ